MERETIKEFIINLTHMCYRVNKDTTEGEIVEKILKGSPEEVNDKFNY